MSPEERAAVVTDEIMDRIMSLIQINGEPIMSVDVLNPAPALIASAIREAQASARNEALEGAAGAIDATVVEAGCVMVDRNLLGVLLLGGAMTPGSDVADLISRKQQAIRNLKTKD